jgi:lysophospholipase L1-like esterase
MSADEPAICWCYGDSFTEGYTRDDRGAVVFRPYAPLLSAITNSRVHGHAYGCSGATTAELSRTLPAVLDDAIATIGGSRFKYTVLLAGTNDLGPASSASSGIADRIMDNTVANLANMVAHIRSHAEFQPAPPAVFVLTVPPLGERFMGSPSWEQAVRLRAALNSRLTQRAADTGDFTVIDLYGHMKAEGADHMDPRYDCGDGLHFNEKGYEAMSAFVARSLL